MSAFDILKGEGKVTKGTTYDCTLGYPILYLETEFKGRVKWGLNLFCTLCIGSGPVACYVNEYTTYIIRSNRRKAYTINILPVTIF
jgi:hypothetical protein